MRLTLCNILSGREWLFEREIAQESDFLKEGLSGRVIFWKRDCPGERLSGREIVWERDCPSESFYEGGIVQERDCPIERLPDREIVREREIVRDWVGWDILCFVTIFRPFQRYLITFNLIFLLISDVFRSFFRCLKKTSPFGQRCIWIGHFGTFRRTFWDNSEDIFTILELWGRFEWFWPFLWILDCFPVGFAHFLWVGTKALRTDRPTDRPTDGRTDGRTDGHTLL